MAGALSNVAATDDQDYSPANASAYEGSQAPYYDTPQGALAGNYYGGDLPPDPDSGLDVLSSGALFPGGAQEVTGALTGAQNAADAATQEKIQLIRNASARLAQFGQPDPRMAAQAWINGLGGATPGGSVAGSFANAGNAQMAEQIRQQTEAQRVAEARGNLDIAQGTTGQQGAALDYQMLQNKLNLARQADQARAYAQYRQQMIAQRQAAVDAENQRAAQAAAERAEAAKNATAERAQAAADAVQQRQEAAEQGRYTWMGVTVPDPNDPTKTIPGMWRMPTRGNGEQPQFFPGVTPTARPGAGGAASAFAQKLAAATKVYPNDPQEALLVASGRKMPDPNAVNIAAAKEAAADYRTMAGAENGPPLDPDGAQKWIAQRTEVYRQQMSGKLGPAPAAAPSAVAPQAPSQPEGTQPGAIRQILNMVQGQPAAGAPPAPAPVAAPVGAPPARTAAAPARAPQPAAARQPPPAPLNPAQRTANTVYMTPKGPLLWSGTGWRPVSGAQ